MSSSNKQTQNLPKHWGPIVWKTIDIFVAGYGEQPTEELREAAQKFFESMTELLPCPECRAHYKKCLEEDPVTDHLENQAVLEVWVRRLKAKIEAHIKQKEEKEKKTAMRQQQSKATTQHPTKPSMAVNRNVKAQKRSIQTKRNHVAHTNRKVATSSLSRGYAGGSGSSAPGAAQIKANYRGSQDGLKRLLHANKHYIRPCAC